MVTCKPATGSCVLFHRYVRHDAAVMVTPTYIYFIYITSEKRIFYNECVTCWRKIFIKVLTLNLADFLDTL